MRAFVKSLIAALAGALLLATQASAAGIKGAPAPFDKGNVKIAVVSFLGSGDWLQAFEAGVKRQADALGIDLTVSQARNDNDTQRSLVEQAINRRVDGIIINNGRPEVLKDVAQKALDAEAFPVLHDTLHVSAFSAQQPETRFEQVQQRQWTAHRACEPVYGAPATLSVQTQPKDNPRPQRPSRSMAQAIRGSGKNPSSGSGVDRLAHITRPRGARQARAVRRQWRAIHRSAPVAAIDDSSSLLP